MSLLLAADLEVVASSEAADFDAFGLVVLLHLNLPLHRHRLLRLTLHGLLFCCPFVDEYIE